MRTKYGFFALILMAFAAQINAGAAQPANEISPWLEKLYGKEMAAKILKPADFYIIKEKDRPNLVKDTLEPFKNKIVPVDTLYNSSSREWMDMQTANMIKRLDHTHSYAGKKALEFMFEPIADKNIILLRQDRVRELAQSKAFSAISKSLEKFGTQGEEPLLRYLTKDHPAQIIAKESKSFLGKTAAPLIYGSLGQIGIPFNLAQPLVYGLIQAVTMKTQLAMMQVTDPGIKTIVPLATGTGTAALMVGVSALLGSYTQISKRIKDLEGQQRLLMDTKHSVKALKDIYTSIKNKPALRSTFAYTTLNKYFNTNSSNYNPAVENLLSILERNTFSGEPSAWLSLHVNIQLGAYAMHEVLPLLPELLAAVGEIDAYASIAHLYQNKDENAHFTMANFVENESPYLKIVNAKNVLIDADKAVPLSFEVGTGGAYDNILFSGPHGAGKSTAMRTVAQCIALGQSIGVAPADEADFTIMDGIITYVNIVDDIEAGQSSFVAEQIRMQEINLFIQRIKSNGNYFILVDEPAAKTIAAIADPLVHEFITGVLQSPRVMLLVATHHQKAAGMLAKENPRLGVFHPEVIEPQRGEFMLTYRILPGPAQWWNNDEETRTRFIKWRQKQIMQDLLKREELKKEQQGDEKQDMSSAFFS